MYWISYHCIMHIVCDRHALFLIWHQCWDRHCPPYSSTEELEISRVNYLTQSQAAIRPQSCDLNQDSCEMYICTEIRCLCVILIFHLHLKHQLKLRWGHHFWWLTHFNHHQILFLALSNFSNLLIICPQFSWSPQRLST